MTLLRLEWLRLVRTRRLLALTGVYLFFGIAGPLTARYLGEIVERFGGDGVGEEEVWASVEVQFGVHHLVEIRVAHRRVVGAVVEDRRRRA